MPSPATVTGHFQDATSATSTLNSFVRFRLRNYSGFVPRVIGTTTIVEPQVDVPVVAGAISVTIWGNDNIDPINTFWTVEYWSNGRIVFSGNYLITGSSVNLDTAPIINPPSAPSSVLRFLLLETNGVPNINQFKLNLHSSDSSITLTDDGLGDVDLQAHGVSVDTVQAVSTNTTLVLALNTNYLIQATAGGGGISVTLPSAVGLTGQKVAIKKVDNTIGAVLIGTTSGQTIDGTVFGTSYTLSNYMQFVTLESNGANWNVVAGN